jgi:hypothetical protein
LNEDSIKYPIVEYLIADGDDSLKNIKLEDNHPVFITREVDLISKTSSGTINYCIEFKFASKLTMNLNERQRILDDIARLYFVNYKTNASSFLIVAGKTIDFLTEFRSVINKTPGIRGPHKKIGNNPVFNLNQPCGFFSDKWLSFDLNNPKKNIEIKGEQSLAYKNHYEEFEKKYIIEEKLSFPMPEKITTILKYITDIKGEDLTGNIPAMVGIWQVVSAEEILEN